MEVERVGRKEGGVGREGGKDEKRSGIREGRREREAWIDRQAENSCLDALSCDSENDATTLNRTKKQNRKLTVRITK